MVTCSTRQALDQAGERDVPVISGATECLFVKAWIHAEWVQILGETRLVYALQYLRAALDKGRLEKYHTAIGDKNPVPIVHYRFLGTVARVDQGSDLMKTLIVMPANALKLTKTFKSSPFWFLLFDLNLGGLKIHCKTGRCTIKVRLPPIVTSRTWSWKPQNAFDQLAIDKRVHVTQHKSVVFESYVWKRGQIDEDSTQ